MNLTENLFKMKSFMKKCSEVKSHFYIISLHIHHIHRLTQISSLGPPEGQSVETEGIPIHIASSSTLGMPS